MDTWNHKNAISRREAIRRTLLGTAGFALGTSYKIHASEQIRPLPAKAVIQIWMWGGPSHLDTFDPKPNAGYDYCGPFNHPIPTNVDGILIGESLPLLAQQADKYSILRSMTHASNAHETASYIVQTGQIPGRLVHPSVGAVVSLFTGLKSSYSQQIPPYILLTSSQGRFSEAGFLGSSCKPFATGGDPNKDPFAVEGIVLEGVSDARQHRRRKLLHQLDSLGKAMPDHEQFAELDRCEQKAYDLMFGETRSIFDLTQEKSALRDRYGRNTFGQSCLVARRLVEQGVPYITINYKGWDTHKAHFEAMKKLLPELDAGLSALLVDLQERDLLKSTIVWWSGEFGRTPRIQWESPWNGGRGHYGKCFSAVVAGGGFKGGHVVGASDDKGQEVLDRPVYPWDLIASIYLLLGIDPEAPLPNDKGLNVKVLPSEGTGQMRGGVLREIMT